MTRFTDPRDPQVVQLEALLIAAGYSSGVAEALAESNHNPDSAQLLSIEEALDEYLSWNGIIGFTSGILETLRNLLDLKPEWAEQVLPESMQ